uniref:WD repeat domain 75 n=1 Tax=Myripristis murdjan TaxID=586833 RepID=A0A667ZPV7_9TELE
MVEHGDIRVVHRGGSKINFREPVLSHDSRLLLCASGECVKVFSSSTEECVHDLQGHTDLVTGVLLNPSNHLQAYSCSADGTVRLWDFTDGILIKVQLHCHHVSVQPLSVSVFSLLMCMCVTLTRLLSSSQGEYIASAKGLHLEVYFFKKQKFSLKEDNKKGAKNTFTCLSCHPKDDCIATGHEDGKIRLWRNFNHKREYTYSTLHWHHSAVSSVRFTPEGTNLLSGGVESVLVQWRYNQETQKDFLPRLGAAITHIAVSPDGELFCTAHSDNKLTVIQSCVKVSAVIQGLVKGESVRTDLMVDPRSKALVLNGKPGHLQFYSLQRDKQLYNLDIVQQEYIHESGLQQFEVVKAAFDTRGNWLATVEERKQKDSTLELNLKLWAYDEQTQSFVLNTTVSGPHEARITAMCFCHTADSQTTMLVSASQDGHFKAWQLESNHYFYEGPFWSCDFVGAYHSLVPECCCFSADGSLLAISFQEVVTVWSPASWELLTTLSQPPGAIRDLCFGRQSCSKYLLGTTAKNLLCCWNLLTCTLEWSTSMDVSLLLSDPLSENMAAFCSHAGCTDLFVFKPSEPRPLFSHKAICSGKVTRAVFAPREEMLESCEESSQWLNRSQLYFLTQYMVNIPLVIDDSVAVTPFYLLLGKHRQQQQEKQDRSFSAERNQLPQGSVAIKELLHTPAHVLPSASFLCSMFVRSLLISEKKSEEEEMESDKEEESECEMEASTMGQGQTAEAQETAAPALTKAQARELRRVKKLDHSWLSSLLDS